MAPRQIHRVTNMAAHQIHRVPKTAWTRMWGAEEEEQWVVTRAMTDEKHFVHHTLNLCNS